MTIHLPPDNILRAITIREPFASLIAIGAKCIENRNMPFPKKFNFPMTLAIHAGADEGTIGVDIDETINQNDWLVEMYSNPACKPCVPGSDYYYCQTVVGLVDVVGCVCIADCIDDDSECDRRLAEFGEPDANMPDNVWLNWANGPYCYVLRNARRFRTGVMMRGQLGFWKLTAEQQALVVDASMKLLPNPRDLPTVPIGGVPKCPGKPLKLRA